MPILYENHVESQRRKNEDRCTHPKRRTVVFLTGSAAMAGVEYSTVHLAQRLERSHWNPLVICPAEGQLAEECRQAGVAVRVLPRPALESVSFRVGNGLRLPNPIAWAWDAGVILLAARSLRHLLWELRPDLVVTKGMFPHLYGGLACRRAGVPCLWHAQDFVSERFGGLYRRCFGQVARWLPTAVVADGKPIARQFPRAMRGRVHVIYNGVDINLFRPGLDGAHVRRELGIPPSTLVVGHVARMTPWKGQHYLLEAFARLTSDIPEARLLFVGASIFDTDSYENGLKERATALGLAERVIFAGYRRDLSRLLAAMDIFAYPSVEKDTTPLALLSALAAGLPVVAFDIEGVREVVSEPEYGLLVPAEQIEPFATALMRVLTDDDLRRRLALGSRRRAEQEFSLEQHVSRFEDIFLDLINAK